MSNIINLGSFLCIFVARVRKKKKNKVGKRKSKKNKEKTRKSWHKAERKMDEEKKLQIHFL